MSDILPHTPTDSSSVTLTDHEARELLHHEHAIQSGLETFEVYCREKWGMSKRHADRLVGSAAVAANLGPIGPVPTTESQARPLTKLPPAEQPKAWERAQEIAKASKEPVKAKHVEAAVKEGAR